MNRRTHVALYRATHALYPRAFREEYGEDLGAVFETQLDELGAARCWLRTLRDLIVSIPTQQQESRMKKPSASGAFIVSLALGIGATLMAVVIGTSLFAVVFLLMALAALVAAFTTRRAAKPVVALERSGSWKKFLGAGSLLLALLIVLMNLPANRDQELSTVAWSLLMFAILLSLSLIAAGVVLRVTGRRRNP